MWRIGKVESEKSFPHLYSVSVSFPAAAVSPWRMMWLCNSSFDDEAVKLTTRRKSLPKTELWIVYSWVYDGYKWHETKEDALIPRHIYNIWYDMNIRGSVSMHLVVWMSRLFVFFHVRKIVSECGIRSRYKVSMNISCNLVLDYGTFISLTRQQTPWTF